jgi:uncharacterized membrane protein HdeD (DUF308 family)
MLAVLATHWSLLLFRGSIAVIFGMLTPLWPEITLGALLALFGAYAFADGCLVLIIRRRSAGRPRIWRPLVGRIGPNRSGGESFRLES